VKEKEKNIKKDKEEEKNWTMNGTFLFFFFTKSQITTKKSMDP